MRVKGSALIVIVATLPALSGWAMASQSANAGASPAVTAPITVSGRVTDGQGQPAPGAKVTLYEITIGESPASSTVEARAEKDAGAEGTFTFTVARGADNRGRTCVAVARKEGFSVGWLTGRLQEGERLDLALSQPKELAGEVVDEAGRPLAEAEVNIAMAVMGKGDDRREFWTLGVLHAKTDGDGRFLFAAMPAEATFELFVEKPGRAMVGTFDPMMRQGDAYQFAPGQAGIKLTMLPEAGIEGVVVEQAGGKPVGGVMVTAHADLRQGVRLPNRSAVTGEDGAFRLGGLPGGSYTLELSTAGGRTAEWVAEAVHVTLPTGETRSDVKIPAARGAVIEVLVRDTRGEPVEGVRASLCHMQRNQWFGGVTDTNGLARIRVLPGRYSVVRLYRRGYTAPESAGQATVAEGESKRIECDVSPTPALTGTVRDEAGHPLAGVKLELKWIGMGVVTFAMTSDAAGRFEAVWDPASILRDTSPVLVARDPARNLARALDVDAKGGDLDLRLKPGVIITGTALSQEDQPLPGARLQVALRGNRLSVPLGRGELATAGPDGVFEIKGIPAEREYVVTVSADGYGKQEIAVNLSDPRESRHDVGRVKLTAGGLSITGIVVDPNDNPVAGAAVSTSGAGQPDLRDIQTDAQGRFTIKGVCPGPIRLSVTARGSSLMFGYVQAEGGATEVRITVSARRSASSYAPRRAAPLQGKPLPPLRDLGINLLADTEGKMLLVCFWDMGQRPSRNCLTQLAAQAGQLLEKDVMVVTVHAGKAEEKVWNQWVRENKIPFHVGFITGDLEKTKSAWGVTSLPHLILTDKKHIVVAEGFGLSDLDKQVETAAGR